MQGERNVFGLPEPGADKTASPLRYQESKLASARHPVLRKLAEYEQVCDRMAIGCASFFTDMSSTPEVAAAKAAEIGVSLREFADCDIAPLVFTEPITDRGGVDFREFYEGAYDAALAAFFTRLRREGITDEMMGTWVPFPEANIPVWGNVQPNDVSRCLAHFARLQKTYFPASRTSVLLNSKTYPHNNSWSDGGYASLEPYVESVPSGLIDSLGMQGFAWPPNAPGEAAMLDPVIFLRPDLAVAAAHKLGVKEVWFNTGVFRCSGRLSRDLPFEITPERRQAVLEGVAAQAEVVRALGMRPAIHLFAENKYDTQEAIDWSYWSQGAPAHGSHAQVFRQFVEQLEASQTPLWLFDVAK